MSGTHLGLHLSSWNPTLTLVAASGAAPLGASLIKAVDNKLKSVGANAVVLQG